jgi:hypothetical protein
MQFEQLPLKVSPDSHQDGRDATPWWRHPLIPEIGLVLAVKFTLLFALWAFFFNEPDGQRIDAAQVGTHLIGTLPATTHTPEENKK